MQAIAMTKQELKEKVSESSRHLGQVRDEMQKRIVGQKGLIDRLLIGLVARGHILLEGLPGLAKTMTINSLGPAGRSIASPPGIEETRAFAATTQA